MVNIKIFVIVLIEQQNLQFMILESSSQVVTIDSAFMIQSTKIIIKDQIIIIVIVIIVIVSMKLIQLLAVFVKVEKEMECDTHKAGLLGCHRGRIKALWSRPYILFISKLFIWAAKGKKASVVVLASKGLNLSVIALISNAGLETYQVRDEAFNGELFCDFLLTFDDEILINKKIVMDNARWHYNIEVYLSLLIFDSKILSLFQAQSMIAERGCEVIFNALCSPYLIPIEEVFALANKNIEAYVLYPKQETQ
ncbi:MAG: hypothetical protein EZS28_009894 [Streblomastix strix]|uniref:Tc1-like transposase DDE domain-containing protein n=1 Tax=Streblomastix strix TaxID=222440 RepID=A0A5J4WHN6_9EUKA|nr:MAG: hypothetical protein EZS28_009894 [Streblomastix strix]